MANSSPVAPGDQATAAQYNDLRSDVLDPTTGHTHDGVTGTLMDRPWLGTGADGTVTIAADTLLTRDMHYGSLTINAGVTLDTNGYRIYCRGTVTVLGTVQFDLTDYPWTTLAADITAGATTIVLSGTNATGRRHGWGCLPVSGVGVLKIDNELIGFCHLAYGGGPADKTATLTITHGSNSASLVRAVNGTTAAAHVAGAKVVLVHDGLWGVNDAAIGNASAMGGAVLIGSATSGGNFWDTKRTVPSPPTWVPGTRGSIAGSFDPHVGGDRAAIFNEVMMTAGGAPSGAGGTGGNSSGGSYAGQAGYAGKTPAAKTNVVGRGGPRSGLDAYLLAYPLVDASTGSVTWYGVGPSAGSGASGGAGGYGGASSSQPNGGGGGGSGQDGGVVFIACRTLAGNGTIRSLGTAGGTGGNGQNGAGGSGGAGGGGAGAGARGGVLLLAYTVKTFTGTLSVAGGAAGAPGNAGTNGGGGGSVGAAGGTAQAGATGLVLEIVA